jgi:solute carrier family 35 (UDP-sugar transporter), member A1/2/3
MMILQTSVTYQAKLVTTALVSVVMLQRAYSMQQWICLLGLSLGVATVVLGERGSSVKDTSNNSGNLVVGLIAVSISCLSSALAGVYFEMVLKKNTPTPATVKSVDGSPSSSSASTSSLPPPSLWMRNIQLAFFSVLIAVGQGMWKNVQNGGTYFSANLSPDGKPYLFGFTIWVWILVALQAGGGLLVAAVIKYADNVLKGLATGVSVVLSSALAMLFFATPLGKLFCVGATVILMSVYYFSNPSPQLVQKVCTQHLHINLNAVFGYKQKTGSSSDNIDDSESPSVGGGGAGDGTVTSSPSSAGSELTKSLLPK